MADDRFRLTALDARRWDFGTALRGYDRARVDEFRDQVAEELERLARVNQELETKASNFLEQLKAFRERDKALNEALVSAQQLRGEIRQQAEREAQLLMREAQGEAERAVAGVRSEVAAVRAELEQLRRARRAFLAQQRSLLERQLAELAAVEQEAGAEGGARGAAPGAAPGAAHGAASAASAPVPAGHAPPAVVAGTPAPATGASMAGAPVTGAPSSDAPTDDPLRDERIGITFAVDAPPPTIPEPPPRPAMPTPSWLDAVDDDGEESR